MENNYTFRLLAEHDRDELYTTFLQAFADYLVPIRLSRDQFKAKLQREAVNLNLCGGVFSEDELVGFILTGLGQWQGRQTAYNAGTGVVPEHRGQNLTRRLYQFMLPHLQKSGISCCLLEVMQDNKPALSTYQAVGFAITRSLDCFRAQCKYLNLLKKHPRNIKIAPTSQPDWHLYKTWWDIAPGWQNTQEAIVLSPDKSMVLEARNAAKEVIGYVAFFVHNGAVAQLAVHPDYRRQGIGTALIQETILHVQDVNLMCINVDTSGASLVSFLKQLGFAFMLGQYEMALEIKQA